MAKNTLKQNQSGSMLILTLVAANLFLIITMGAIGLAILQQKLNIRKVARAQALHIAEAGVNYYRWVLYHDGQEYCNKETCATSTPYGPYGPYAYKDSAAGTITGYYELYITPPALNGSTIVNIKSIGWIADYPNIKREVEVQCGIPSWSTFATMTNGADGNLGYGPNSSVTGPIHCNYGCVRMDGLASNIVTSSQLNCGTTYGVYTCRNEASPTEPMNGCDPNFQGDDPPQNMPDPERASFQGGRRFGKTVPIVSYGLLSTDYLNKVYTKATSSDGLLFDPRIPGEADPASELAYRNCESDGDSSCDEGYHIVFIPGNQFNISKVSAVRGAGNFSINTESASVTYNIPDNGIIFVKNTVWVDGHMDNGATGSRATILAFKDPIAGEMDVDIIINENLTYSTTTGDVVDSIGLIAQRHVTIGQYCCKEGEAGEYQDLIINAALLAKNGRRYRSDYGAAAKKNSATIFGHTASFLRPSMSGGFNYRYYIYDTSLTFAPPPHYPTTGEYTFISWKEK